MASIIDSFREVFTDRLSFLKIIVLAIPVYASYQVYLQPNTNFTLFFWLTGITALLLFGFLLNITNNVINARDSVLPSLNIFKFITLTAKGIIAIGPTVLISYLLATYVCSLINIMPWVDIVLKSMIWIVVASVIIASFLMFSAKGRILDAYNFGVLSQSSGDLIVVFIFFIIQLVIINIPTSAFIGYTILILFGYGPIFDFFLALAIVFNVAVTGHYMAQVHYETITTR